MCAVTSIQQHELNNSKTTTGKKGKRKKEKLTSSSVIFSTWIIPIVGTELGQTMKD